MKRISAELAFMYAGTYACSSRRNSMPRCATRYLTHSPMLPPKKCREKCCDLQQVVNERARVGLLVARLQTVITSTMVDKPDLICFPRNSSFSFKYRVNEYKSTFLVYSCPDSINDARQFWARSFCAKSQVRTLATSWVSSEL
jgi:hypothetical protein